MTSLDISKRLFEVSGWEVGDPTGGITHLIAKTTNIKDTAPNYDTDYLLRNNTISDYTHNIEGVIE